MPAFFWSRDRTLPSRVRSLALQALVVVHPHAFGASFARRRQSEHAERCAKQGKAGAGE
jgi:hypothetical protein